MKQNLEAGRRLGVGFRLGGIARRLSLIYLFLIGDERVQMSRSAFPGFSVFLEQLGDFGDQFRQSLGRRADQATLFLGGQRRTFALVGQQVGGGGYSSGSSSIRFSSALRSSSSSAIKSKIFSEKPAMAAHFSSGNCSVP